MKSKYGVPIDWCERCEYAVERARLQLQRISSARAIPLSLDSVRFDTYIDRDAGEMLLQLNASLYEAAHASRIVEVTAELRVPATWVDAFKERFQKELFMRLWLRLSPISYKIVSRSARETVTARALLPDVPTAYGDNKVLYFMGGEKA